jgi:hypothetical protein
MPTRLHSFPSSAWECLFWSSAPNGGAWRVFQRADYEGSKVAAFGFSKRSFGDCIPKQSLGTRENEAAQALLARYAGLTVRGGEVVRLTGLPGKMVVKK